MGEAPYKKLLTYRYAYLIYHLNDQFTGQYLGDYRNRRNKEQMDQVARSGKQNIAEGVSQGTSLKGYIKLLGIARGSLEELLEDYKDFAIKNKIPLWDWKDEKGMEFRRYQGNRYFLPTTNLMADLITRTCYLLDQQIRRLKEKFIREGGFSENLFKQRKEYRGF